MSAEDSLTDFAFSDATLPRLKKLFKMVPHSQAIGFELEDAGKGYAVGRLPYQADLAGDADTGVLHGGVITSLIDSTSGLAVICSLSRWQNLATIDLRIDYMKPAVPHQSVFSRSECYKVTRHIAFVRSTAYQNDINDPIATSVATFMIGSAVRGT